MAEQSKAIDKVVYIKVAEEELLQDLAAAGFAGNARPVP